VPSPSGFVDFNEYADLNQDEEARLMEEAAQRAEAADATASQGLMKANNEAGGKPISQTASYSDYLKQKQDAAKAWAAVSRRSADPRAASLQGGAQFKNRSADFDAREAEFDKRQGQNREDGAYITTQNAALEKKTSDAAEAQRQASETARERYIAAMVGGAEGRGRAGGTQLDFVGGPNPYANSTWAQQQGGWEAAQLKKVGGTAAQQAGVWGAYTGKGRWGQGQNSTQNMNREMSPWAPEDEED